MKTEDDGISEFEGARTGAKSSGIHTKEKLMTSMAWDMWEQ